MGIIQRSHRTDIDWLANGPIGPYVDAFKQHLTDAQVRREHLRQLLGRYHAFRAVGALQAPAAAPDRRSVDHRVP